MQKRLFALMLVGVTVASRGQGAPRPNGRIVGSVLDSVSMRPPIKTFVCAFVDTGGVRAAPRCGQLDSVGLYRIDSIVPGQRLVSVQCATAAGLGTEQLTFDRFVVPDSEIRRDWVVSTRKCDTRPVRRVAGVFRGHYTQGFEASVFIPCPSNGWFLPSDSLGKDLYQRSAWVVGPAKPSPGQRPSVPRDPFGNLRYYVEWGAVITGPGHYGHMGVSPFELRVDSVLLVRAPQSDDCGQARKPASRPAD